MGLRIFAMEPLVAWCLLAAAAAGGARPIGHEELTGENSERPELLQFSTQSAARQVAGESEQSGEDDALSAGLHETTKAAGGADDDSRSMMHGKSLKAGRAKGKRHGRHLRGRRHHKHVHEADPTNASLTSKAQEDDDEGDDKTFDVPLDSELQKHSVRRGKSLKVGRGEGKHHSIRRGNHGNTSSGKAPTNASLTGEDGDDGTFDVPLDSELQVDRGPE